MKALELAACSTQQPLLRGVPAEQITLLLLSTPLSTSQSRVTNTPPVPPLLLLQHKILEKHEPGGREVGIKVSPSGLTHLIYLD